MKSLILITLSFLSAGGIAHAKGYSCKSKCFQVVSIYERCSPHYCGRWSYQAIDLGEVVQKFGVDFDLSFGRDLMKQECQMRGNPWNPHAELMDAQPKCVVDEKIVDDQAPYAIIDYGQKS